MGDIFGNIFEDDKNKNQDGKISVSSSKTQGSNIFGDIFAEEKSQKQQQVESNTQSLVSSNETDQKKGLFSKAVDAGKSVIKFGLDIYNNLKQNSMETSLRAANLQKSAPLQIALKNAKSEEDKQKILNDPKYAKYKPYSSYDEYLKEVPVIKFFNSDTGKAIVSGVSEATSNLPLKTAARLSSMGDKTYDEAYAAYLAERNDPTNKAWQKFLYELQDTGIQSGVGILLSIGTSILTKNPRAGLGVSSAYYTALSADEQLQSKGQVDSVGNIAIDVVGDQMINKVLGGILEKGGVSRIRAALEGFGIEGSTEVLQSLLKYANDYGNAKNQAEKNKVLAQASDYVKSGAIAMEFLVGGTVGGIAGGITGGQADVSSQPNEETVKPKASIANFDIDSAAKELTKLEQTGDLQDPDTAQQVSRLRDVLNDYTNTFNDKTVFVPSEVANSPLIEVVTSQLPSGKVVVKFSANTQANGFSSMFDYSQQFTSDEEATKSATDAIRAWAQSQDTTDPEEQAQLDKIVSYIENPKAQAQTSQEKENIIDSVNPTGSVFTEYTPEKRATANLAENITTLDKTSNKPADTKITIYRGAPSEQADIVSGDFVTTNEQLAKDYAGTGKVISKEVTMDELLDDSNEPLGEEYIYRAKQPAKNKTPKKSKEVSTEPQGDEQQASQNEYATKPDQTFYHGTLAKFDKFDSSKVGENTEWENAKWGFFFIDDKSRAEQFVEDTRPTGDDRKANIMEVELNIKNPIDLTIGGIVSKEDQASVIYEIMSGEKPASSEEALQALDESIDLGTIGDFFNDLYSNEDAKQMIIDAGYDGIVSEFGRDGKNVILEYVAFNPEQISIKKEQGSDKITDFEKKLQETYLATGQSDQDGFSKAEAELFNIATSMELSEAGYRVFTDYGKDREVKGVPSTFPKWVPENLRSKDLFEKILGGLDINNIKYPTGNRTKQRALYQAIFDELDSRLGVDTSDIRSNILSQYEKTSEKAKPTKADDRSTRGGEKDTGKEKTKAKEIAKKDDNTLDFEFVMEAMDDPIAALETPEYKELTKRGYSLKNVNDPTEGFAFGKKEIKDFKPSGYASAIFSVDQLNKGGQPEKEAAKVPITLGQLDSINPIEMPELVDLARELMGSVPKVGKLRGGKGGGVTLGYFRPDGNGKIALQDFLFKQENLSQASKTLAHEIGHLIDYLPDQNLKRGNLLGRLASLRGFMQSTFSFEEGKGLDTKARNELRNGARREVAEKTEKKQKDFSLADKREVKRLYQKKVNDIIQSGGYIRDAKVKKELLLVSRWWKPYDPKTAPEAFKSYRESSVELYADAISVLFNAPKRLQDLAPTFYNSFFEGLDAKPDVRDAYFEVQSLLSGDKEALTRRRREGVKKMFKEGDYKAIDLHNRRVMEKENRRKQYWSHFKHTVIDKNFQIIDRVKKAQSEGKTINPDENPVYFLEERNYIGGKIKGTFERTFNTIYSTLNENEITWDDFGETLFYARIAAGDRSDVANPRGITPEVAKELLNDVANAYTPEQRAILTDQVVKFQEAVRAINEEAFNAGLYSPELYEQMKANPAYVTFQVLDHLEEGMTSRIYKSLGTLKDITNPADATMLKVITTIRATERNMATKTTVNFLKENFSDEIVEAKYSKSKKGRFPMPSKKPNQELVTFFEGGKIKGYYVDPYIAETINNQSVGQNAPIVPIIRFMNTTLFRPLFISFNLGFQSFNLIRDFVRFYKNTPDMSFLRAIKRYGEAGRIARVRAFGLPKNASQKDVDAYNMLIKLEEEKVLSTTFNDIISGRSDVDKQVEKILADTGIKEFQPKPRIERVPKFAKPAVKLLDKAGILDVTSNMLGFIENLGNLIETLPKAAGVFELSKDGDLSIEDKSFIRRKLGSPDFLAGGTYKPITNEIFLFSNAIIQGIRADVEVATDPKTRSGFWWKTAKITLLPKILMYGVLLGAFGEGLKKLMEGASEYDRTNYTIIPLGTDTNGKPVYFRLPVDETSRFIGGMFWKALTFASNESSIGSDILDVLSYTGGQLPSISPAIQSLAATTQFLAGQNPYDAFRGRLVLSDTVAKAGGIDATKAFLGWQFQQLGGGIFYRFYHEPTAKKETGTVEKIFNAPVIGNVLGRFVRVSDYGQVEKLKSIEAKVEQQKAQETLDERKIINRYINDARAQGLTKPTPKMENDLVREIFDGAPQTSDERSKAKRLVKKLTLSIARGNADPNVTALVDASSNDVKLAILKEIQSDMSPEEFSKLRTDLLREGIVSGEVFNDLLRGK